MWLHIWIIISLLSVGLVACSSSVTHTTPEPEFAESVSVTVEPSPTATVTNTPQPTKTAVPTQTSTPIPSTNTPIPTAETVLPERATDTSITNVILSSKGQLAYIRDEILYAEIAPQTGEFEEIGHYAHTAAWSPDGSQIVYSTVNIPDADHNDPATIFEQRLWFSSDYSDILLSELIANYPDPAPGIDELYWTPDGMKILIHMPLSLDDIESYDYIFKGQFSTVDLNLKTWGGDQLVSSKQRVLWLTDDVYILRYHCGSPCANISAYDYSGNLVWSPDWRTGSFVDFASNGNFMINVGRIYNNLPDDVLPTLDKIDLSTGDIEIVWELPVLEDDYFTAFIMPSISPDEQYFSFDFGGGLDYPDTLYIVDQWGNEVGLYQKSYALGWDKNNNLMLNKLMETGENQLQLVSLDGSVKSVFTTNPGVEITGNSWTPNGGGEWSPDGQYFAFITSDSNHKSDQLYLWKTDDAEPILIHSLNGDSSLQQLNWLSDSTGFYFLSGRSSWQYESIWYYDIESNDLKLVVPTSN